MGHTGEFTVWNRDSPEHIDLLTGPQNALVPNTSPPTYWVLVYSIYQSNYKAQGQAIKKSQGILKGKHEVGGYRVNITTRLSRDAGV